MGPPWATVFYVSLRVPFVRTIRAPLRVGQPRAGHASGRCNRESLPALSQQHMLELEVAQPALVEDVQRVGRAADHRFAVQVEARVQDGADPGARLEGAHDGVIAGIVAGADDLW